MNSKRLSLIALGIVVAGVLYLVKNNFIISSYPVSIAIQLLAITLMIWARFTFGLRSFHAAANTTEGKLVTTGPYRWFRHPIYASLIYFFSASVISFPRTETVFAFVLIVVGLFIRMLMEEKFLLKSYDEYKGYAIRTKRIIPFVL